MGGYHQLPITGFNPPDTGQDLQKMVQLRQLMQNAPVQRQILQQQESSSENASQTPEAES